MSQIAIEKKKEQKTTASLFGEMKDLSDRIRQHAFELFERRGGNNGCDLDDWLSAERELLRSPESELLEQDGKFEVRVSAAGFQPGDVHITAFPDAIIVKATSSHQHHARDGQVRFCEFGQKTLLRQFDMPEAIDQDKVTAHLENGVLHLTAPKAKAEPTQKAQRAAA